ncbi:MAG: hypothetical protein ACYDCK_04765 [Thermoplasmatota archaeon]
MSTMESLIIVPRERCPTGNRLKLLLSVEDDAARDRLAEDARRNFAPGEMLVRLVDRVSLDETTLTLPADPDAEVVAIEAPRVMIGGFTELTSYLRVKRDWTHAIEHTLVEGQLVSSRDVELAAHAPSPKARDFGSLPPV